MVEEDGTKETSDEPKVNEVKFVSEALCRAIAHCMIYDTRKGKRKQKRRNILTGNWQMKQSQSGYV
mgnify:CR=1 FL=1